MVAAIVILYLLVGLIGAATWLMARDCGCDCARVKGLQGQVNQLSGRVNALTAEVKTSHARLLDRLWRRASAEVDQEIERARARGRQS
jgi:hypothetical protein